MWSLPCVLPALLCSVDSENRGGGGRHVGLRNNEERSSFCISVVALLSLQEGSNVSSLPAFSGYISQCRGGLLFPNLQC